ncbi:MAG: glycosyltransferase involved in cell wall biosynthesis [Sphingobacteriales bacterium]
MTDISIVVPLLNEAESLPELYAWIERVMRENKYSFEVIFVDDGSKDTSWQIIEDLHSKHPENVRAIKFRKNHGKSPALNEGFAAAVGEIVVTMDADLQDSPEEIPAMRNMILNEGYDLVSGWKSKRYDPLSKTIPTKLFNFVTRKVSGIELNDFNCGLKAYRNEVVKNIEIFGEMHRYIPVLAKWAGYNKIGEKPVIHQARKYGVTKFGINRFINGFLDLMTLFFVGRFSKKPMHFFGTLGALSLFSGFLVTLYVIGEKLVNIARGTDFRNVTDQPLFFLAILAIIVGFQLFSIGFIGDLISRNSTSRNHYSVTRRLGLND